MSHQPTISLAALCAIALTFFCATTGQTAANRVVDNGVAWIEQCDAGDAWDKPGPPFRIYGSSYYVGTCGITAVLIAGHEGHVLIDGGKVTLGDIELTAISTPGHTPGALSWSWRDCDNGDCKTIVQKGL
jgi:glyoxylase-like metal-dependent hydrolase (beta-lactamase superfamily II)